VRDLTKDSLKNNTTVTLITFVSAFYLPGGFVAVSICLIRLGIADDKIVAFWNEFCRGEQFGQPHPGHQRLLDLLSHLDTAEYGNVRGISGGIETGGAQTESGDDERGVDVSLGIFDRKG
jgi:hypothetical protein